MQQILVIHGGNAFEKYEDYLNSLHHKELTLEQLRKRDWKGRLQERLGDEYDVLTPRMPNNQNARYLEWKIFFEKIIPLLSNNVILIGHSLGGIFLAKYLSENPYPQEIKATLLVAAPFNTLTRHPLVDFNLTAPFALFRQRGGQIHIYHSKDDKVVHFANAKFYKKEIPEATVHEFLDRGHFNQEEFPELVADIRSL